jgi:hypothetical protein
MCKSTKFTESNSYSNPKVAAKHMNTARAVSTKFSKKGDFAKICIRTFCEDFPQTKTLLESEHLALSWFVGTGRNTHNFNFYIIS